MENKFLYDIGKAKRVDKTRTKVVTHSPANPGNNWYSIVANTWPNSFKGGISGNSLDITKSKA